jgi:YtkA-like protein
VQLGNRNGRLKPGMYATVDIQGSADDGLSVPANALVDSGTEQVVFVAQGDGYFTPKRVKAGRRLGDRVEIVDGLKQGEQVASSATFFLDSESQLRGGLQNYEPSSVPAGDTSRPASSVDFSFRSLTEPPKTGENEFEVLLKDAAGTPITDADVSVRFFMPAMPTMNMPAMKNEVSLPHIGNGAYRGSALVMMGGSWDVTVTASKGQQLLGRKQLTLVAK